MIDLHLHKLKKLKQKQIITRFAPSPTGHLHAGHVLNLAIIFALKEFLPTRILFRLEDHDQGRCRPEYLDSISAALEWLEVDFDSLQPLQSQRENRYQEVLNYLRNQNLVFPCTCSRKTLIPHQPSNHGELWYPGICRDIQTTNQEHSLRLKVSSDTIEFYEWTTGENIEQTPKEQCGDFIIQDRYKQWSYVFANCVDDMDQKVNLVIRGLDLFHSTGRQIFLHHLLQNPNVPQFYHHPLLCDAEGKKLSKRQRSESIMVYKDEVNGRAKLLAEIAKHFSTKEYKSLNFKDLCGIIQNS